MVIIKGNTTAAEIARSHDLTIAEIDQWIDDFVSQGTEALRSHPRDAEALHKAEKKELLAKIGDLTMQIEVLQIAREYLGWIQAASAIGGGAVKMSFGVA